MPEQTSATALSDSARPVAAVDLGSNSFHMLVVRALHGQIQVLDRLREMVQLGAGLDRDNHLTADARERALQCLERFGQRLRSLPPGSVRVVGTNTLRKARDTDGFVDQAQTALGHPIEVISGIEEARLIYLGVAHSLADEGGRRLVVDIGGGSTEVIIGKRFVPLELESLYMGCVSMSRDYFAGGVIDKIAMREAEIAAGLELEGVAETFRELGWQQAVGSSGTAKAIARVVQAQGWCDGGISRGALKKLRKELLSARHVDRLTLKGLSKERAPVFPGGVAVLWGVFEALGIEHMQVSDGALREGLVFDLLGRIAHEDVREHSVEVLGRRCHVDTTQAARVERTALASLARVADRWGLQDEQYAAMLGWAARLHEIGLNIAHGHFHKHGAYIAEHSDMPGFSYQEQQLLAVLIRGHRRKLPVAAFRALPGAMAVPVMRLCILLRLAVKLHHSRSSQPLPDFRIEAAERGMRVEFPAGWLAEHALTAADLAREAEFLAAAGLGVEFI